MKKTARNSNTPLQEEAKKVVELKKIEDAKKQNAQEIKDTKLPSQYRRTKNSDVLNEIPKHIMAFEKYGQMTVEGDITTQLTNNQAMSMTLFQKPSGLDYLQNLNKEDLKQNLDDVFKSVDQQTAKLLDVLIVKQTENGFNNPTVTLDIKEYASIIFGGETPTRSQVNKAREKAKKGIKVLKYVGYTYKKGKTQHIDIKLYGGTSAITNGKIIFKFNDDFFRLNFLLNNSSYLAVLPIQLLSINEKYFPNSYLLAKKLWSLRRINRGKKTREKVVSVKTLYDYVITLPRYKDNNSRNRTIIEPFERDLDAIENTGLLKWNYNKEYIDKLEKGSNKVFEDWLNASIIVEWCDQFNELDASIVEGRKKHNNEKNKK